MYTGKKELPDDKGAMYHTVMRLLENHLGQGYCVFMDNYYSSPILYKDLVSNGTDAVGTVISNRKNYPSQQLNSFTLKRGESTFLRHNDITALRFFEKRNVYMLSTRHGKDLVRVRCKGATEDLNVPLVVHHYNCLMGGVDLVDQYLVYYALGRKSMKWYRRVYWRLIEMAIFNSFVVYKANHGINPSTRIRQLNYRLELSNLLVKPLIDKRNASLHPIIRSPTVPDQLLGKHFIYRSEIRRRCRVCVGKRKRGHRKERADKKSYYFCKKCDVHLCIGDCFMKFHTLVDYSH